MKKFIFTLITLVCISITTQGQNVFKGFTPFKLEICGQEFYNASPQMIGVMKSHIGDYIPPLDMSGDGWIGAIDVVMLLQYQQQEVWFPDLECIDQSITPFVYDWQQCGCMPNPGGCGSSSYCLSFLNWIDYGGVIGELSTTTYGANNFKFIYVK